MKRSILFLIPVLLATLIFSCKRNDDGEINTVTPGSYRSLDEAINSAAPLAKTTSIIVPEGGTIVAENGTTFYFPPNIFETLNGDKVTGSVTVTIQDWLNKGDMIFGRVLPQSFDSTMESAGEAYVNVTQNGQVLRIRQGSYAYILFPQLGTSTWPSWVGRTQISSTNTVNWINVDTTQVLSLTNDSVRVDTLHYIQIAQHLPYSDSLNFTVKYTAPVVLEQSMAYAIYVGHRAIYPIASSSLNGIINAKGVPDLPLQIVVMGINSGHFYAGISDAVVSPADDSVYKVTLKAMEPPTLRAQLNAL